VIGYAGTPNDGPWCWVHAQNIDADHQHLVGEPLRENPSHARCMTCGHDFQPLHPVVVELLRALDEYPYADFRPAIRVIRALGANPQADVAADLALWRASVEERAAQ
jgi:hypothetical protein